MEHCFTPAQVVRLLALLETAIEAAHNKGEDADEELLQSISNNLQEADPEVFDDTPSESWLTRNPG